MKTYQNWGEHQTLTSYLNPGDEVDQEMVDYFCGTLPPQTMTSTGDYALPGRRNRLSIIFLLQKKLKTKSSATSILKVSAILSVTYGIMVAGTGSILPAKLKVR